jgi:hypothetical protein
MIGSLMGGERREVPCTVEVEKTWESLHAHVELNADIRISPGDEVRVLGEPIEVDFGQRIVEERRAEVQHAGPLERTWTKFSGLLELMELLEFSFTSRRNL